MPESGQERTEQPTSRRREEARSEGSFAQTRELGSFLAVIGGVLVLQFSGAWIAAGLADILRGSLSLNSMELTPASVAGLFRTLSVKFVTLLVPAFFIPLFAALSYVLQNGFVLTGKPLSPDIGRINPFAGVKRLLSLSSAVELVKALLKVGVLGYAVWAAVRKEFGALPSLVNADVTSTVAYMAGFSLKIMTKTAWVLALIAALDYIYQRWQFEKGIRMTKEELREEARELEGNPMIKARIKSMQRDFARKRMMQEVPKADVVVTNPTHLAVALKYDRNKMKAPSVVAKGAALLAQRIREVAGEHGVPVVENKPLAQSLYKNVEVGREIPAALYRAVAELLAYVYRLKAKRWK